MANAAPPNIDLANHITLKFNLKSDQVYQDILQALIYRIQSITSHLELKNCLQLLLTVANICEALVLKKDNIDKQSLVLDAMTRVFNLTEAEQNVLKSNLNFLSNNGNIKSFSKVYSFLKKGLKMLGMMSR